MSKKRNRAGQRRMFRFWLDTNKVDEAALVGDVDTLKRNRKFTQTIRDGIRLIMDLRRGSLDVLFELFPWVRAEFLRYMKEVQPEPQVSPVDIAHQLAELKLLMEANQGAGSLQPVLKPSTAGPKQLNVPQFASPTFDDDRDDLMVTRVSASAGLEASQNFINSIRALTQ